MSPIDAILIPLAALMALVTAGLVKWAADAKSRPRAAVVVFLLMMMVEMFGAALVYFVQPGPAGLVTALWVGGGLMSLSVFPLVFAFLSPPRTEPIPATAATGLGRPWGAVYLGSVVALVLLNEFLMGWTFLLASGSGSIGLGLGSIGAGSLFAVVVSSPWFLFTMAAEMLLTAFLLRDRLGRPAFVLLIFQAVITALAPPALAFDSWVSITVIAGSGAMIALIVFLMEYFYRNRQLNASFATYVVRLLAVYAVMMAGLFAWAYQGSLVVFALSIVAEMVLYFAAVLEPLRFALGDRVPWQLHAGWTFGVLFFVFVAELFMGALLDLQIAPLYFTGAFVPLPLTGTPAGVVWNAVYNGFWFVVAVTASTWFLAMMGFEMGALVYFKYRETRVLETRVRLILMMGCYAAFAVFFPSLYYSAVFPSLPSGSTVPFLGWSMGIGTAPLAPTVFIVVAVTYGITGALSGLFGRRAICSTFCTAALMYQGTTIDSMKSFNRSSRIGRKYLGSRFSTTYSITLGVVLLALFSTSVMSYLNQVGILAVTILGADPTVFLFALSFGVLWYVLFFTIPYVGDYNCVTLGWCYTGIIAGAFSRIGFFKLKVKDPAVCRSCTTLDCAKACPVGLVDMPGHFRTKGEFRSSKCCGVGNCVGSCPYGNLYIHDVRHWVRRRLRLPEVPGDHRLPMVGTRRPFGARAMPASPPSVGTPPGTPSSSGS